MRLFLILLALSAALVAQTTSVSIKAALVDKDLNVKPIAKTALLVTDDQGEREMVTSFDGTLTTQCGGSHISVRSKSPVEMQGKRYTWKVVATCAGTPLTLELSNDNASIEEVRTIAKDDAAEFFQKYQNGVVTVWAEVGPAKGTGFVVDKSGLILTNQHVVSTSQFIEVQFDEKRFLPAVLLASDASKDVAVLAVDLSKVPDALILPLHEAGTEPAEVGEKVFTIGSPLNQRKILTTGIVSKVEKRAIFSDVNINPGNSGGPLFNSMGKVIGITTFGDAQRHGPGISGIVRIEEASQVIETARSKFAGSKPPSGEFLPVTPTDTFPIEAIKANLQIEKFKVDPYVFGVGDYDVAMITPILIYRMRYAAEMRAAKEKQKRGRKSAAAVQGTFEPLQDLRNWGEYVGEYEPVLLIQASPKLKEGFWSAFGRGMAASQGYYAGPARLHFKTDFYRMKLLCGSKEVQPIFPGKSERVLSANNLAVNINDATFDGLYKYSADAITASCGTVTLQLFSEKNPNEAKSKVLDAKTVSAITSDFTPYLASRKTQ